MSSLEDDLRSMLRRRANDVDPIVPDVELLATPSLIDSTSSGPRPVGRSALRAAAVLVVIGLTAALAVGRWGEREDELTAVSPRVGAVPFEIDARAALAVWPVGADGSVVTYVRALESGAEPTWDLFDAGRAAAAYLDEHFGSLPAVVDEGRVDEARGIASFRWLVLGSEAGGRDTTEVRLAGSVYLRRVPVDLPQGTRVPAWVSNASALWVVVGALAEQTTLQGVSYDGSSVRFGLVLGREVTSSRAAIVVSGRVLRVEPDAEHPGSAANGSSEVDVTERAEARPDEPTAIELAVPGQRAVSVTVSLLEGSAPIVLAHFGLVRDGSHGPTSTTSWEWQREG